MVPLFHLSLLPQAKWKQSRPVTKLPRASQGWEADPCATVTPARFGKGWETWAELHLRLHGDEFCRRAWQSAHLSCLWFWPQNQVAASSSLLSLIAFLKASPSGRSLEGRWGLVKPASVPMSGESMLCRGQIHTHRQGQVKGRAGQPSSSHAHIAPV